MDLEVIGHGPFRGTIAAPTWKEGSKKKITKTSNAVETRNESATSGPHVTVLPLLSRSAVVPNPARSNRKRRRGVATLCDRLTAHTGPQRNKQICPLTAAVDPAYQILPKTSEISRRVMKPRSQELLLSACLVNRARTFSCEMFRAKQPLQSARIPRGHLNQDETRRRQEKCLSSRCCC
jgi:hypothetical protein